MIQYENTYNYTVVSGFVVEKDSFAAHVSFQPLAFVDFFLGPPVLPVTVLETFFILSDVGSDNTALVIRPGTDTVSVHFAILPFALVFMELALTDSLPVDAILKKLALIKSAVWVCESSFALFQAVNEFAYILRSVFVILLAVTVLYPIEPCSFVKS